MQGVLLFAFFFCFLSENNHETIISSHCLFPYLIWISRVAARGGLEPLAAPFSDLGLENLVAFTQVLPDGHWVPRDGEEERRH